MLQQWIGDGKVKISRDDIANQISTPINCEGRDVVFFSISVLNKISKVDQNLFQILSRRVINYKRIRFIFIETFGWQVYLNNNLNRFFLKFDADLNQVSQSRLDAIQEQIREHKNADFRENTNLGEVIFRNIQSDVVAMNFFQADAMGLRPARPYSVASLMLK